MKVKTKLIASIMSICLVCAVFAIGVFALKTANLKIGGDVSFSATGVEADIKNVTLTGATTNDQVLATGSINTSMTQADINTTFQNWQSLKLDFDESATDIELKFQIANTSTNADNYIEIDYSYSFSNSSPNVDVFPGDENAQSVWENNEYILAPKGSAETATYKTFTLKFKVLNKELNVPQDTNVSVNIELKHVTPVDATTAGWTFTENAPAVGEATIKWFTGTLPENKIFEIPSVLKNGGNNYIVTKIYSGLGIEDDPNLNHFIPSDAIQLSIPNSIKELWGLGGGEWGDYSILSLTNIIMPKSLSVIGDYAFFGCSKLTSVNIPYGVKTIRECAFDYCTGLTTITIPSSVTSISGSAFSGTSWYNNQPDGPVYINNVLYKYKGIMPAGTSIEVKEGTVSISGSAFYGCTGLTSVIIGDGVTSIGGDAFRGCTSLTSITIPNSVTSIGSGAFYNCTNLSSITIPNSMTSIGNYAFYNCSSLTTITIPSSVTSIGSSAFQYCTNLTSVKFEETTGWSVANIADGARTPIAESEFTTDASAANANLLKTTYKNKYWFRTVE